MFCESDNDRRNACIYPTRQLLNYFVWHAEDHYGPLFAVCNVHGPDDAATFECSLDDKAAFSFENFLGWLKKLA